jgi:hypothetical protein
VRQRGPGLGEEVINSNRDPSSGHGRLPRRWCRPAQPRWWSLQPVCSTDAARGPWVRSGARCVAGSASSKPRPTCPPTKVTPLPEQLRYNCRLRNISLKASGIVSAQATERVAETAVQVGAPSKVLAAAHAATLGTAVRPPLRPEATAQPDDRHRIRRTRGPVEQTLRDLDVVDPAALNRAATIDQAAEQLILRYAQRDTTPRRQLALGSGRSTATAQLINHLLACSSPSVDTIMIKPTISRNLEAELEP